MSQTEYIGRYPLDVMTEAVALSSDAVDAEAINTLVEFLAKKGYNWSRSKIRIGSSEL